MIGEGASAPDFQLPGVLREKTASYSRAGATDRDQILLLLFYPFDFSPVCTGQLCAMRDAEWFLFTPGVEVWGISGDSTYAHEAFIDTYDLNFPLLSDYHGSVAARYGVQHEECKGHEAVPKRAVFVVDTDGTVVYAWATDEPFEEPALEPVEAAVREIRQIDGSLGPADPDLGDLSVPEAHAPDDGDEHSLR